MNSEFFVRKEIRDEKKKAQIKYASTLNFCGKFNIHFRRFQYFNSVHIALETGRIFCNLLV